VQLRFLGAVICIVLELRKSTLFGRKGECYQGLPKTNHIGGLIEEPIEESFTK